MLGMGRSKGLKGRGAWQEKGKGKGGHEDG